MRSIQKVTVSLLVSVALFSVFAFLAFSGLFDVIESDFYSPRVQGHYRSLLSESAELVDRYHQGNIDRFESIIEQEAFARVFEPNQSQSDIESREDIVQRLNADHASFAHLRIGDRDGTQLHFSTLAEEYEEQDGQRVFAPVEDLDFDLAELMLGSGEDSGVSFSTEDQQFLYRIPVNDTNGIRRGTAVFGVGTRALAGRLASAGIIDSGRDLLIVEDGGFVMNVPRGIAGDLRESIESFWAGLESGDTGRVDADGGIALPFEESADLRLAYFLPESELELGRELEVILLTGTFFTLFLVTFLLLNLRQDSSVVLSERVRRFQISMLREYLERRNQLDWDAKAKELERLKPEVTKRIKRGIGKVRREDREQLDELVEKGWSDIVDVIAGRSDQSRSELDMKHLESMLERVVSSLGDRVPQALPGRESDVYGASPGSESVPSTGPTDGSGGSADVEGAEPVEEAEALEEAEPVEEMEALEGAEPVEEAEALEEAEPVEEAEALEEAEPVEEMEALEEAEPVGELESLEDVEPLEEIQSADDDSEAFGSLEEIDESDNFGESTGTDIEEHDYVGDDAPAPEGEDFSGLTLERDAARESADSDRMGWNHGRSDEDDPAGAFMNAVIEEEIEAIADEEHARSGLAQVSTNWTSRSAGEEENGAENDDGAGFSEGEVITRSVIRRIFADSAVVSSGNEGVFQIDQTLFDRAPERGETADSMQVRGEPDSSPGQAGPRAKDSLFLGDIAIRPVSRSVRRHRATASTATSRSESRTHRSHSFHRQAGGEEGATSGDRDSGFGGDSGGLLRPDGIDFDRFLRRYRSNDAGIVRALVFFTRRVGAPVALIMLPRSDGYRGQYSLGLDEGVARHVHVPKNTEFARSVLGKRAVFHYQAPLQTLPGMDIEADPRAVASFKRSLFIPIQFRNSDGYLVLGLPVDGQPVDSVLEQVRDTIASG